MNPVATIVFTQVKPCSATYQWCMHIVWIRCIPCFCRSLVTPSCSCAQITKSCSRVISIHLCCLQYVRRKQRDRRRAEYGGKIQSFSFSVSGYFPRFHKQVLRSGKQHIEREMEGRRRKLDEKRGGSTGYNPTTSKKASLSPLPTPFTFIISTNEDLVQNQSRSWWRCHGFGRRWANCR